MNGSQVPFTAEAYFINIWKDECSDAGRDVLSALATGSRDRTSGPCRAFTARTAPLRVVAPQRLDALLDRRVAHEQDVVTIYTSTKPYTVFDRDSSTLEAHVSARPHPGMPSEAP